MIVSFVEVKDLNNFLAYLKSKGIELEEHTHVVLADSSELEIIVCKRRELEVAYMVVHYIDSHYAALSELREDATDREILEALFSVNNTSIWRIPVEPVLYVSWDYNTLQIINSYRDRIPREGEKYLERYLTSHLSTVKVINADTLISIAYSFKNYDNHGQPLRS